MTIESAPPYGAQPVYSERRGDAVLVIYAVLWDNRESHQLYVSEHGRYELVGMHRSYGAALADLQCWVKDIDAGVLLADWSAKHPHGVIPTNC